MFEGKTSLRVRELLEKHFDSLSDLKKALVEEELQFRYSKSRSTNERNMTRKTRTRKLRVRTAFEPGFCALCHVTYSCIEEHVQSRKHLKLIGDDANYISMKGFDSFLALDGIDGLGVTPFSRRSKMPRTRAASVLCDRVKESPLSPVFSDSGHHLRSRKNINYMTPPLEEDSLTEKPDDISLRELRSSTKLVAKLTDQIQIVENDDVWNSGRPKRSCNRQRISADERLVADNKSYYKVEVLPTKLRSGVAPFHLEVTRSETPDDKGFKFKKLRNSELMQLNSEAENFLFPKKNDSSDEEDEDTRTESISSDTEDTAKVKTEDEESMHSTCSESKEKKRRRTHAEAFIMDNQKYYKFETPGSRLRYQGSYLSPVPTKSKYNGDCVLKTEPVDASGGFNVDDYHFSFEAVPKKEAWFETFQRMDKGQEKYVFLSDEGYWDPFVLPYQLNYIPPLNPQECINQYNQIRKCLLQPSTSTSVTCSTPDPTASNSSNDVPFTQDEDSKISAITETSSVSTIDDVKSSPRRTSRRIVLSPSSSGKNPRKSPRQHASTLAILSSLIHQRKKKPKKTNALPTISEETPQQKAPKKLKIDYFSIARSIEEDFAKMCEDHLTEIDLEEGVELKGKLGLEDILNIQNPIQKSKRIGGKKPGRKPGKRKKNRTGWPRNRRNRRVKEEDESTVDSNSVNSEIEEDNPTDSIKEANGENNNKSDQSSLSEDKCDNEDRVESEDENSVLKVNNIDLQYQPYVRVQKLDKVVGKGKSSPKRTNRGRRRMPASPKSPRMLRRPRGRWYRER